mmetsp:Transcript_1041/g.2210  ORF Transcript_1041/g.2210 Transcript_1041/m.2210 type:complete len:139 (+) Transcript_1041:260-676(+)
MHLDESIFALHVSQFAQLCLFYIFFFFSNVSSHLCFILKKRLTQFIFPPFPDIDVVHSHSMVANCSTANAFFFLLFVFPSFLPPSLALFPPSPLLPFSISFSLNAPVFFVFLSPLLNFTVSFPCWTHSLTFPPLLILP